MRYVDYSCIYIYMSSVADFFLFILVIIMSGKGHFLNIAYVI